MKNIVLISCVSKKKNYETTAENLYDSTLFKYALQYAKSINPDKIYILSALYGLLETTDKVEPYNKTLNDMSAKEKKEWSTMVLKQMRKKEIDLENDRFVFLAGNNYRKYLVEHISHYQLPLEGKRIGEQVSYLKGAIKVV
ncbi:DUF6884 domain-containing protein [Neobacillus sp. SAB-20_R2A]|uniref:DUF6884 domain-containing protein n=1 Tax=Neobacillus sp. SAB-20_R2A TaxID=3120519 RepID=UPI003C6E7158